MSGQCRALSRIATRVAAITAVALVLIGCAAPAAEQYNAEPANIAFDGFSLAGRKILFAVDLGKRPRGTRYPDIPKTHIYVAQVGSQAAKVTRFDDNEAWAAWSPDGRRIAFNRAEEHETKLHVVNVDGSGDEMQLTDGPGLDSEPTWSPDGRRIAFTSFVDNMDELHVINPDGSNDRTLIPYGVESPAWSPDGSRIAFVSGFAHIAVIDLQGGKIRTLTRLPKSPSIPSSLYWSPDGRQILFEIEEPHRRGSGEFGEIYIVNADGSGLRRLTTNRVDDWSPQWTPKGKIVFLRHTGGGTRIYTMNPDGSGTRQLRVVRVGPAFA